MKASLSLISAYTNGHVNCTLQHLLYKLKHPQLHYLTIKLCAQNCNFECANE